MADSAGTGYQPQGDGPHPTLAGNMLDPGVSADGKMSQGQGVGGTSEQHIKEEGLEHIKRNTDAPSSGLGGTSSSGGAFDGTSSSGPVLGESGTSSLGTSSSITPAQPPASNPGADDGTAGIGSGHGGLSGTSAVNSPEYADQQQPSSMLGTVKNYLGLGGSSQSTEAEREARNVDGYDTTAYNGSSTGRDAAALGGAGALGAGAAGLESERNAGGYDGTTSTSAYDASGAGGDSRGIGAGEAGAGAIGSGAAGLDSSKGNSEMGRESTIGSDPASEAAPQVPPKDNDVTTGNAPTDSADPTTKDTAVSDKEQQAEGGEEKAGGASSGAKGKGGINLENPDAIPFAGGEKLGKKHWGESKIVPENPKPQTEANVSSEEGQPTDQVRDNTSKNTGGASGGPQHTESGGSQEKEGLADKLKDKLHMGGHK